MTRTYRINPDTPRASRLARARVKLNDEARALYFAAREARALYELETRERRTAEHAARRASMADAMSRATTRDYARAEDDVFDPSRAHGSHFVVDAGSYPECLRCSKRDAGCIGNSEVTCYVHERYAAAAGILPIDFPEV